MENRITAQGNGVYTIDTGFQRPGLVACHIIVENGHAVLVDPGTDARVSVVLDAMDFLGVRPEQLDYVMITHVHLDHAGGSGRVLQHCPNARLVVHPRGARHMIDPSRLMAGAAAVYGEDYLKRTFGDMIPVSAERVIEAADDFSLEWQGRTFTFLDTPGHAKHHYCMYDNASQGFFTGDTFGLSYREFDNKRGVFLFPTTTPVQFDPDAMHDSIDRLLSWSPKKMYLTHFGVIKNPERQATNLHELVNAFAEIATRAEDAGDARYQQVHDGLKQLLFLALEQHGCELTEQEVMRLFGMDLDLNTRGLLCWLDAK